MPYQKLPLLFFLVALAGCSALVNPDDGRLGGGSDGGPRLPDARITLRDGNDVPPPGDGGVGIDRGTPPECAARPPRCEGAVLVECIDGRVVRTDCAAGGGTCSVSDGCVGTMECDPGTRMCEDSTALFCTDGGTWAATSCPAGCEPSTGTCRSDPPTCPGITTLHPGSTRFDLCGSGDDETYTPAEGCRAMARANGADVMFRIELAAPATIELDLRDDDTSAIDTVVYIRTVCDDETSQVGCGDDVPCSGSDIPSGCIGGVQVRQSRLRVPLEAGTYYVVADSFMYTSSSAGTFGCGEVLLEYTIL